MSLSHSFGLVVTDGKLRIEFDNPHFYDPKPHLKGLAALDAVLTTTLHLKENEDYTVKDGNHYERTVSITIETLPNVTYVLDYLLNNKEAKSKFSFTSKPYYQDELATFQRHLWRFTVACLDMYDKLSITDLKKLFPIMQALLEYQYNLIKEEKLVQKLEIHPNEKYGDDLFAHPFYQTLRMLKEDFHSKLVKYNTKHGLFEGKPTEEKYQQIYAKFIDYIPKCFCDSNLYRAKVLSAEKLKRAVVKEQPAKVVEVKSAQILRR